MVLHIPGDIIGTPAFERTLDDVALMSLLGVKIVLVCGIAHQVGVCVCGGGISRGRSAFVVPPNQIKPMPYIYSQIDRRLREGNAAPKYCGDVRITDSNTLRIVKEEAGYARCEIESILSRGFKGGNIGNCLRALVMCMCMCESTKAGGTVTRRRGRRPTPLATIQFNPRCQPQQGNRGRWASTWWAATSSTPPSPMASSTASTLGKRARVPLYLVLLPGA